MKDKNLMYSRKQFHNNIRYFRLCCELTQTELAIKCNTTQNTISSLENGDYQPSAYLSGLLCMALGVKWEDMFWYDPEVTKFFD